MKVLKQLLARIIVLTYNTERDVTQLRYYISDVLLLFGSLSPVTGKRMVRKELNKLKNLHARLCRDSEEVFVECKYNAIQLLKEALVKVQQKRQLEVQ